MREALVGGFDSEHALIVSQILAHLDFLDEATARLSAEIEERITPFARQWDLLMTIPGVQQRTAEVIIAEIGVDMSAFPPPKHLAFWAGVCPGHNESGGKRRTGKTRKGSKWLRATSPNASMEATKTKDSNRRPMPMPARAARTGQGGPRRPALDLTAAWHMLQNGGLYREFGGDYYTANTPTAPLVRQLEALGHIVTLQTERQQPRADVAA